MQPYKVRSSRRAPSLKDHEIDHEISLIDHAAAEGDSSRPLSPDSGGTADLSGDGQPLAPSESTAPLTGNMANDAPESVEDTSGAEPSANGAGPSNGAAAESSAANGRGRTPSRSKAPPQPPQLRSHQPPPNSAETAIDILYENERGGFLCGMPLFSGAALGNLDPAPWTNEFHKPSPTDITTAQVPDPSWEWAWPEWRINHDECIDADKDGWEYSFMFSKKFSWHAPHWYNSFVRRRAWIRRRIKKGAGYQPNDPLLLSPGYFDVSSPVDKRASSRTSREFERTSTRTRDASLASPTASRAASQAASRAASRAGSRLSRVDKTDEEADEPLDIETVEDLMLSLRQSRIDRERLETVYNYLEHDTDELLHLQDHMHEIMGSFEFQASRRLLLTELMRIHDEIEAQKDKQDTEEARRKLDNITAAVKHADEEVRRLEYWSDVKGLAEGGVSAGAVDKDKGWKEGWDGLDKSGAKAPMEDDLP